MNKFLSLGNQASVETQGTGDDEDALEEALASIRKGSMRYGSVGEHKPWVDDTGVRIWSFDRIYLAKLIQSQTFETTMGVIIIGNLLLMVYETNRDATCYPDFTPETFNDCPSRSDALMWLATTNEVLLVIYSIECVLRMYVERTRYLYNKWNHIDLFTVLVGWLTKAISAGGSVSFLRIFRVFRLLRAARVLIAIREFYLLMSGFISSLRAIFFGSLMLITVIIVWAILVVQVIHPTNAHILYDGCERCSRGFASVQAASLTLFQTIVAGDSWGQISIPVIEENPIVAPIMLGIVVTIGLGIMNLILAVIVERATEARENDVAQKLKQVDAQREKDMFALARMCREIDEDGSGSLSLEEMLEGCDTIEEFRKMMFTMDLRREDVETLFHVLDVDRSGEVSYLEFCQLLDSCTRRDPAMLQSIIKYSVMEVRNMVRDEVIATLNQHSQMLEEQLMLLGGKAGVNTSGVKANDETNHHENSKTCSVECNNLAVTSAEDKAHEASSGCVKPADDEGVEQVPMSRQISLPLSQLDVLGTIDSLNSLCQTMKDGEERLTQLVSKAEEQVQALRHAHSSPAVPVATPDATSASTKPTLTSWNDGHPSRSNEVPLAASGNNSELSNHHTDQLRANIDALGQSIKHRMEDELSRDQRIQQVVISLQSYLVDQDRAPSRSESVDLMVARI